HTEPEIRRVDLAGAVLQLRSMGENDLAGFPWLEAPPEAAAAQALALLQRVGAIGGQGGTELGRGVARLPVHPRIGRLLVEGQSWGHPERAALAAALLSERDPFTRTLEPGTRPVGRSHVTRSDVLDRVETLEEFELRQRDTAGLNRGA